MGSAAREGARRVSDGQEDVTGLLRRWRDGDSEAMDRLVPLVYDELRRVARRYLRGEAPGHTLQTTALVHEAYLRLVKAEIPFQDRVHFFAVAANTMRRILVDHARAGRSAKRGGGATRLPLETALQRPAAPETDLVEIDDALRRLEREDERKGRVVELHFFGGLGYEEIAELLGISPSTVRWDMRIAKAWLRRELAGPRDAPPESSR